MSECNEGCSRGPNDADPEKEQTSEEDRVKVRLTLFFDGTGNNRGNTDNRQANSAKFKEHGEKAPNSSYFNDWSNVARLEKYTGEGSAGYDIHIKVYIEGIGTVTDHADDGWGNLAGEGKTGVKKRVDKGLLKAIGLLEKAVAKVTIIEKLTVDTCGFSRGAAAARYCVHRVLHTIEQPYPDPPLRNLKLRLRALSRKVEKVEVKAVMLWDTVSALGVAYIDISDVGTLYLDTIREAKAVLHLAAAEEYRWTFSLTNINSARNAGVGWEVFLPGAHSDVGGGYTENSSENKAVYSANSVKSVRTMHDFLRESGWYSDGEFEEVSIQSGGQYVKVNRKGISQQYSFLPLRFMADFAKEQDLEINGSLYSTFTVDNIPSDVRSRLESYAAARGPSKSDDWKANDPGLRGLRHDFLHFSCKDEIGYHMRVVDMGYDVRYPHRRVFDG
jgi:hypothetical protein